MNVDIANRLYEYRKQNNLSQEELADKIGVSRQAVSKWERAEASPDTDNLILLSRLYGVSLDSLLSTAEPVTAAAPTASESIADNLFTRGKDDEDRAEEKNKTFAQLIPYPIIIALIYLIIGFCFQLWHPGWILFLTIPVYYGIADFYANRREIKGIAFVLNTTFPVLTAVAYLILGFCFDLWHPGWMIFLLIPLFYGISDAYYKSKHNGSADKPDSDSL